MPNGIRRASAPEDDFLDGAGILWDVKSPPGGPNFDAERLAHQILGVVQARTKVLIDASYLTQADYDALWRALQAVATMEELDMIAVRAAMKPTRAPTMTATPRTIGPGSTIIRAEVRGRDLHGADLGDVGARDSRFVDCNFDESYLAGATFYDCEFQRCTFRGAHLRKAVMDGCRIDGCDFAAADMRRVYVRDTVIRDTRLDGADVSGAYGNAADALRSPTRAA